MGDIRKCAGEKCGHAHAPSPNSNGPTIKKACARCDCKEFKT